MEIKICGLREGPNIAAVGSLAPDYMGFIFFPASPRNCSGKPESLLAAVPDGVTPVAVTVDMPYIELSALCARYGFTTVQLHGDESPEYCSMLQDEGLTVWKTVPAVDVSSMKEAARFDGCVDMLLFDTSCPSHGGSGRKFDWTLLSAYSGHTPFMLSGGISPTDAEEVLKISHPRLAGIDVNSRFESSPGVKDVALLTDFINKIRYNEQT